MDEWAIPTRQKDFIDGEPFANDLFGREVLAIRLTDYIYRLREGCVIGIDAPWGEGKTWFGKNWEGYLKKNGFKTVYLDAFQHDYFEDPFLALSAEILSLLEKENPDVAKKTRRYVLDIGKVLFPIGSKVLVSSMVRWSFGSWGQKTIEEAISKASENFVENRLKKYEEEKKSVDNLKKELSELALEGGKPIVFFVDELDRCKPPYAIKMLERIKHFFDIPNLVFVLMINRNQLERSVEGIYGLKENETNEYLQKFVHFFLRLPKRKQLIPPGEKDFIRIYGRELAKRFGLAKEENLMGKIGGFIDAMAIFAFLMDFSLRDTEKAFILFSLTLRTGPNNLPIGNFDFYLAYLISLKIKYPDLFSLLLEEDKKKEGHRKCMELIKRLMEKVNDNGVQYSSLEIILLLHEAHSEFPDIQPEDHNSVVRWQKVKQYFQSKQLPIPHNDIKLLIPSLLKYIDLSVE